MPPSSWSKWGWWEYNTHTSSSQSLWPWRWWHHVPLKYWYLSTILHSVRIQTTTTWTLTRVKTLQLIFTSHGYIINLLQQQQKWMGRQTEKIYHSLSKSDVVKITIFWDVMPYSVAEVSWHSRGTYWLHFQGRRIHFCSEEGSSTFLYNIHKFVPDDMASYLRRH
jgi:hypothetical protein